MFEVTKDKAQQFKVLSALMKDKRVTELVCATDAGREGELIFRLVYNKAGCTKPFKRLWISSLEDSAIREGFNHLRDGKEYDRLYEAALSRSKADWIVGINGTRLFTTLYHKKLVVGRVQTPTLAMLVERDGKISTFQKEKYFNVHVGKGDLTADLEKVKTEEEAKRIAAACEKKQAVVSSLKRETKTVDMLTSKALQDCAEYCATLKCGRAGNYSSAGVQPTQTNVAMGEMCWALPSGRKALTPLADTLSAEQHMDVNGPLAAIQSYGKINHSACTNGTILNMWISKTDLIAE